VGGLWWERQNMLVPRVISIQPVNPFHLARASVCLSSVRGMRVRGRGADALIGAPPSPGGCGSLSLPPKNPRMLGRTCDQERVRQRPIVARFGRLAPPPALENVGSTCFLGLGRLATFASSLQQRRSLCCQSFIFYASGLAVCRGLEG